MSVQDTATRVQEQVLDAIKAGQDAVLSAVDTLADSTTSITEKLPSPPFADRLPKPQEVLDSYFTFAQKLLANQKDFAIKLVDAYRPAKPAASGPKSASKAA